MIARHNLSTILVASVGLLVGACASEPDMSGEADRLDPRSAGPGRVLYSYSPASWYSAYSLTALSVAPDGTEANLDFAHYVDLATGGELALDGDLDQALNRKFDRLGNWIVRGIRGGSQGWFRIERPAADARAILVEGVPFGSFAIWSPTDDRVAYWTNQDRRTLRVVSPDADAVSFALPGNASSVAWLPSGDGFLVLVIDERGIGTLHELDSATGESRLVAEALDGHVVQPNIAVTDDGRFAYLALASAGIPDPEVRHDPDADRDLDIYELDLVTGERRPVVQTPSEDFRPVVAGSTLHWVAIETTMETVLITAEGGQARLVAAGVQGPTWHPDGQALGVITGRWRLADWALNLDAGMVEIDAEGQATGPVTPIVTGYHEDFSPVWSPDGAWIAYHSHRSATPVAGYASEGSTDDVYLRRPDAPTNEEIRLTDFGLEVGTPDWAPDGRRILIDSWNEGGGATAWILEMDPEQGTLLGRTAVPQPAGAQGTFGSGTWSPTGDEIALTFGRADGQVELWVMAPDGSGAQRTLTFEGDGRSGVDWMSDGESLVYSGLTDGRMQLFSVPRERGEPRRLTDDPANLMHPQVSPDGRWIAATRIKHDKKVVRWEN